MNAQEQLGAIRGLTVSVDKLTKRLVGLTILLVLLGIATLIVEICKHG